MMAAKPSPNTKRNTIMATKKTTTKTNSKKSAKAKPTKATAKKDAPAKTAPAKKAKAKTEGDKKMSALDAAAKVLAESKDPLRAKDIIEQMAAKGYWTSPGGKT